jgi:lipoprotein signal peptidase
VYRWPTFNIADSVIIAGAVLLVIVVYIEDKKKSRMAGN